MSEISEKQSERAMSTASLNEAADLLRELAGTRRADESMKAVLRRVRRRLADWKPSRVRDIWYRDPRVKLRAGEIEHLRAIANRRVDDKVTVDELAELRSTVERLAKYEALLQRIDAEFFSPEVSAARDQAGQARGLLGDGGVRR